MDIIARVQSAWAAVNAVVSRRIAGLRPEDVRQGDTVAVVLLRLVRQALTTCGYRRAP